MVVRVSTAEDGLFSYFPVSVQQQRTQAQTGHKSGHNTATGKNHY